MKIIAAILDQDSNYTNRLMMKFADSYSDKLELHSFSDEELALKFIKSSKVSVFLANYAYDLNPASLPPTCGFAYLVDSADISRYKEQKAVCKYQKADLIYKEILAIFYEKAPGGLELRATDDDGTQIIAFMPCAGGVGSSIAAVACAKFLARQGKRVLYLNTEKFADTDLFFKGAGSATFSDVIAALKLNRSNLAIKIESALRLDASGVSYFATATHALDTLEFTGDDLETLCANALKYECIIIDSDFGINGLHEKTMRIANRVVLVNDGSEIANSKFMRIMNTLAIIEDQKNFGIMSKIGLLYNRFGGKASAQIGADMVPILGAIPKSSGAPIEYLINSIVLSNIFSKLI